MSCLANGVRGKQAVRVVRLGLLYALGGCAAEVGGAAGGDEGGRLAATVAALSGQYITTYSTFDFADGAHSSREIELTVELDSGRGSDRYFAHFFRFAQDHGYIGLQTDANRPDGSRGKIAIFSIWNASGAAPGDTSSWATPFGGEGEGYSVRVPYEWQVGRTYKLRIERIAGSTWGAYVTDTSSGAATYLGSIDARAGTGLLQGSSVVFTEYYGPDFEQCSDLPLSRVRWGRPTANGGTAMSAVASNSVGDGACRHTRTSTGSGPTVHTMGWSKVLYVGDSIAAETGDTVVSQLQATGRATVATSAFPGMALCDFLEVEQASMAAADRLRARVAAERPTMVVLQFWGNAFTPCISSRGFATEDYYNQYFWNALNAPLQIAAGAQDAGIPRPKIVWVLQGPENAQPPPAEGTMSRPEQLNGIYEFAASHYGDTVSDAGWHVSSAAGYAPEPGDRYRWTQFLPCTNAERSSGTLCTHPEAFGGVTQLHKDNDPVHFCLGDLSQWYHYFSCGSTTPSPGIVRYGSRIADDVKAQLGL